MRSRECPRRRSGHTPRSAQVADGNEIVREPNLKSHDVRDRFVLVLESRVARPSMVGRWSSRQLGDYCIEYKRHP